MSRLLLGKILVLTCTLALMGACDGDSGTDAGPMTTDAGGGGTDAGGGDVDAGGGDVDAGGGGTDAGGGDVDAGGGGTDAGGGASPEAVAFCMSYETTCGFGASRYADLAACEAAFDGYTTPRQMCVTMHLGLAASDAALHCPHATGEAPCN